MSLIVAGASTSRAQSVPEWSQFQGDAAHTAVALDGPPPPYRVRWRLPAPSGDALSTAAIAGDRAFSMSRDAVYAIDLATGEVAWEVPRAAGPITSPAVAAGSFVLFVDGPGEADGVASPTPSASPDAVSPTPTGTPSPGDEADDPPASALVALAADDGTEVWRAELGAISRTGVTVGGETAYVGDGQGSVTAVDVATGDVRWSRDVGERVDVPLAATDAVVAAVVRDVEGREVTVAALGPADGEPVFAALTFRIGSSAASSPSVVGDTIVVGMPDRLVRAFSLDDGTELWTSLALSVFSPGTALAAAEGELYLVDLGAGVYAVDAASGDRRWSHQLNDLVVRSAPVRIGDVVLVGLDDGRLAALDVATGHLVWSSPATPGLVGPISVGADVVVAVKGGRDAGLIAFEPDPEGRLVDVPSPTQLDLGETLPRVAISAAIALAALLIPGLWLRRRRGLDDLGGREGGEEWDGDVDDLVGDDDLPEADR